MNAIKIIVKGKVHAVGFRQFAKECAERLSVHGVVRNAADATVEIIAEAHEDNLSAFIEMIRPGPPKAASDKSPTRLAAGLRSTDKRP